MRPELQHVDPLSAVRREMRSGERLLWSATPRPDGFRRRARPITRFGKVFSGFAGAWMAFTAGMLWILPAVTGINFKTDSGEEIPLLFQIVFPFFGVPFLLVGLAISGAGRREMRRAGRTAYAITDQRALIWEIDTKGEVRCESFAAADLANLGRTELPDGSGDLALTGGHPRPGLLLGNPASTLGFYGVENVREVQRLLAKVGSGSSDPPS